MAKSENPLIAIEANFRRLLATGQPVALEDAAELADIPEGFDRRASGSIPRRMLKDGLIVEAGFRRGESSRCNQAVKRLWRATDALASTPREGLPRE